MLVPFTVFIMLAAGYVYFKEGLLTSLAMFCNVFLAGIVAFNFFEPLANLLEPALAGSFLAGFEDALCLVVLFCVTLGVMRLVTNNLANTMVDYHQLAQQGLSTVLGLLIGYLVAGFLICVLQTLPLHETFMSFEWQYSERDDMVRQFFPPDRVWLSLMRRAGAYPLSNEEDPDAKANEDKDTYYYDRSITFDKYATFELRYARYRRHGDNRDPLKYQGELERQIHRKRGGQR
jgi:hypothetical protein